MSVGDLEVDACQGGCGGLWFDNFELEKVDEPHEAGGQALLEIPTDETVKVDLAAKRSCPKCGDVKMKQHFFSVERKVTVDECGGCGGVWLDAGELRDVREMFSTEEERKAAADKYFDDVFGEKLKEMAAEREAGLARARKVAGTFRFICPSYYLPGKQKWGAF
jgi:Zn-finger nucleic acid-binding protein